MEKILALDTSNLSKLYKSQLFSSMENTGTVTNYLRETAGCSILVIADGRATWAETEHPHLCW
jgi:hypothetical protein